MSELLTFQDGCPEDFIMTYPVTDNNFPPTKGSRLVSPRIGKPNGLARPTFPGEEGFEEELTEVYSARFAVMKGIVPEWIFERYGIQVEITAPLAREASFTAELLGVSTAEALADLVRMDSPTDLGRVLIRELASQGAQLKEAPEGHVNFLEIHSKSLDTLGRAQAAALEAAFEAKYYFGRPRPGAVARDRDPALTSGLFAQYPWPNHPAYPAGHGAAAGATVAALNEVFELSSEQKAMVLHSAAQFAMARTLSGMHYTSDNESGFILGYLAAKSAI